MQRILLFTLFLLTQLALSFAQPKSIYYSRPNEDNYPSLLLKDNQGNYIIAGEAKEHGSNFQFETGGTYPAFYAKLNRNGQVLGDIPNTSGSVSALYLLGNKNCLSLGKYLSSESGSCNGIKYSYSLFGGNVFDPVTSTITVNASLWKSFENIIDKSISYKFVDIASINDSCALEYKCSYRGDDKKIHCLFDGSLPPNPFFVASGSPSRQITYDSLGQRVEDKFVALKWKTFAMERGSNSANSLILSISYQDSTVIANYSDAPNLDKVVSSKVSKSIFGYNCPDSYIQLKKLKDKNYLLTNFFPEKNQTELVLFGEDLQIKKKTTLDFEVVDIHEDAQGTLFFLQNDDYNYYSKTKGFIRTVSKKLEPIFISKISTKDVYIRVLKFLPDSINRFVVLAQATDNLYQDKSELIFHDMPICADFVDSVAVILPKCTESTNGSVTVYSKEPNLSYYWNTKDTTSSIKNLSVGTYMVTITNQKGCSITKQLDLNSLPQSFPPLIILQTQPTGCFSDGAIKLISQDTTMSYLWDNGATTAELNNLNYGTYQVTLTSSCGSIVKTIVFTNPSPPMINIVKTVPKDCFGIGSIKIVTKDTTFSYLWSNGATTNNLQNLNVGTYTLTMTNACGKIIKTVVLAALPSISIVKLDKDCDTKGVVWITNSDTTATYLWENGATTKKRENLEEGHYFVTISNTCYTIVRSVTIIDKTLPPIALTSILITPPKCAGSTIGTIQLTGNAPFNYTWSNGQTGATLINCSAGVYTVTVENSVGCKKIESFTLTEPLPITIANVSIKEAVAGATGAIQVSGIGGGTPPYDYLWNNGATSTNLTGLSAGTYTLTITDKKNCELVVSYVVNQQVSSEDIFDKNALFLDVYPNPISDDVVNVRLHSNQPFSEGTWELYTTTGQQIARFPLRFEQKDYRFNVNALAQGLYLYTLKLDGKAVRSGKVGVK
jgi:hypothetical protein